MAMNCRLTMATLLSATVLAWMVEGLSPTARAEVVLDGTMGAAGSVTGPDYAIASTVGTQEGSNLFHGFATFNILNGESATFLGPATIDTVIARVSGNDPSQVNGPLRCTIPGADLYLLNPAGILFGPQAALDLGGSFYASTASFVTLGETGRVDMVTPAHDLLTMAPPQAFGFVGSGPGMITVGNTTLAVGEGEGITLIGGPLALVNSEDTSLLQAPGGRVNLVAVSGPGQVGVANGAINTDSVSTLGVLTITHAGEAAAGGMADVDVASTLQGGGGITIRSGRFVADGATLSSVSAGVGEGGDIDIEARQELLLEHGAGITTQTWGQGAGGAIRITTPELTVATGSTLNTATWSEVAGGGGQGGDLIVKAGQLLVTGSMVRDDELVHSAIGTESLGSGPGGDLMIAAQGVVVTDEGWLSADAFASGAGGQLLIKADAVAVRDHGWLSSDTFAGGHAGGLELLTGSLSVTSGGKVSTDSYGAGNGGAMTIQAREMEVSGYSLLESGLSFSALRSETFGSGQGGAIAIAAPLLVVANGGGIDSLSGYGTSGDGGAISVTTQDLSVQGAVAAEGTRFASAINASSYGTGGAGDIAIKARTVTVADQGAIYTDANGEGAGGEIRINAEQLAVMDHGWLSADSYGAGAAGSLDLATEALEVTSGGMITSDSYGSGKAGQLAITAERVLVSGYLADAGAGEVWYSTISSDAEGSGDGGEIRVAATDILLDRGGGIETMSRNQGSGAGGSIAIQTEQLTVRRFAEVNASSFGTGQAGDIRINAGNVALEEVGTIASYADGAGDGGDIRIAAQSLGVAGWTMVNGSTLASTVDASSHGAGKAGTITIDADRTTLADQGTITSLTTDSGAGGDIWIESGSLALTGAAMVNASAYGSGPAGDIAVRAATIALADKGLILSMTADQGSGGTIALIAEDSLLLHDAALTSASTSTDTGAGRAGNIRLEAGQLLEMEASVIATSAENGDGGDIVIDPELIDLQSSEITTSVRGGAGNGGNITMAGKAVALEQSQISANAYGGNGGNIAITADLLLQDPQSLLSASSVLGLQGVIVLQAPFFDMGAEMADLPEVFFDPDALLAKGCVEREEEMSWFVVRGRDGLPPSPASLLMGL